MEEMVTWVKVEEQKILKYFNIGLYWRCFIACLNKSAREESFWNMYALMLDLNVTSTVTTSPPQFDETPALGESKADPSIHHYARYGLCRHFEGRKNLYNAFKTKFCDTKISFTADFVIELCRQKGIILDKWVAELFDLDGDGSISHYEKHYYLK